MLWKGVSKFLRCRNCPAELVSKFKKKGAKIACKNIVGL
jgi:hypothetical protein